MIELLTQTAGYCSELTFEVCSSIPHKAILVKSFSKAMSCIDMVEASSVPVETETTYS